MESRYPYGLGEETPVGEVSCVAISFSILKEEKGYTAHRYDSIEPIVLWDKAERHEYCVEALRSLNMVTAWMLARRRVRQPCRVPRCGESNWSLVSFTKGSAGPS